MLPQRLWHISLYLPTHKCRVRQHQLKLPALGIGAVSLPQFDQNWVSCGSRWMGLLLSTEASLLVGWSRSNSHCCNLNSLKPLIMTFVLAWAAFNWNCRAACIFSEVSSACVIQIWWATQVLLLDWLLQKSQVHVSLAIPAGWCLYCAALRDRRFSAAPDLSGSSSLVSIPQCVLSLWIADAQIQTQAPSKGWGLGDPCVLCAPGPEKLAGHGNHPPWMLLCPHKHCWSQRVTSRASGRASISNMI